MFTHDKSDSLADQGHSRTYQEKECFLCVHVDAKLLQFILLGSWHRCMLQRICDSVLFIVE